jgi:hypothetical protein
MFMNDDSKQMTVFGEARECSDLIGSVFTRELENDK